MHVCIIADMRARVAGRLKASVAGSTGSMHYGPFHCGPLLPAKATCKPSGETTFPAQLAMDVVELLQHAEPVIQSHQSSQQLEK
jgi:hypothetical protein